MVETHYLKIESSEPVSQFLEQSVEDFLSGEESDVRVTELDPNAFETLKG